MIRSAQSSPPDLATLVALINGGRGDSGKLRRKDAHHVFAAKMSGLDLGNLFIPDTLDFHKFLVLSDNLEQKIICDIHPGDVLKPVSIQSLRTTVHYAMMSLMKTKNASAQFDFHFSGPEYKKIADEIVDIFPYLSEKIVAPFRFKSDPGYCWQRIPFDPEPGPTTVWDQMKSRFVNPDQALAVELWLGALFTITDRPQQALWLHGPGRDGKGTLIEELMAIFGERASASILSKSIDKYTLAAFPGKRLVSIPDCRNVEILDEEFFYQVTGGDRVSVRRMRQEATTEKLDCMLLIASNKFPEINWDPSLRRRLIFAQFEDSRSEDIPDYRARFSAELPALVYRCMDLWKNRKSPANEIPIDETVLDDLAEKTSDDDYDVIANLFTFSPGDTVTCHEFWRHWKACGYKDDRATRYRVTDVLRRRCGIDPKKVMIKGTRLTERRFFGLKVRLHV